MDEVINLVTVEAVTKALRILKCEGPASAEDILEASPISLTTLEWLAVIGKFTTPENKS